jgi:hypothetical protein
MYTIQFKLQKLPNAQLPLNNNAFNSFLINQLMLLGIFLTSASKTFYRWCEIIIKSCKSRGSREDLKYITCPSINRR